MVPDISKKLLAGLILSALLISGGADRFAHSAMSSLRVTGAYDMTPLADAVQKDFQHTTGIGISIHPSTTSLEDLHAGLADMAILGREPRPEEMKNLQKTLVGYDAVCILISSRSYYGGLQEQDNSASGGLIMPEAKFSGLQYLSLEQLKNIEANLLLVNHDESRWYLSSPPYFTYKGHYDPVTNAPLVDPSEPNLLQGTWDWKSVDFSDENLIPGKFDTQAVLMDKLGFPQTLLNNIHLSFASRLFDSEEELISARFEVQASPQMANAISVYPFDFFIRQASRRVTLRAMQHGFLLKALGIEGINPLVDPKLIYNNVYPLSRKIYIVTTQPVTPDAKKFIDYLLSQPGQKLIAAEEFLPLPSNP